MLKKKIKLIVLIIIVIITLNILSVYAAYNYFAKDIEYTKKDGTVINVGEALNELYKQKEENSGEIEKVWSCSQQSVNYTYTVEESGTYLIGIMNSNYQSKAGTITTDGKEVISKSINANGSYVRSSVIKIIKATTGDKINVNGYNAYWNVNAFISKLYNINVKEIVGANISCDTTASVSYTAKDEIEKILVVSFANGDNSKSISSTYPAGKYTILSYKDNFDYIDYFPLKKDSIIRSSAYGYNWGGGSVFIFKCL